MFQTQFRDRGRSVGAMHTWGVLIHFILACACYAQIAPPLLEAVSGDSSMDKVVLLFTEPLEPTSAINVGNYSLSRDGVPLAIHFATLGDDAMQVTLNTDPQVEGATYTVTVDNVVGARGVPVPGGTNRTFDAFTFTPGLLKFVTYNLPGADILDRALYALTSHPNFPDNPRETRWLRTFSSTYAYPDGRHDNYGSRITGVFVAPVSGEYIFYLRSDDAAQLWFNPAGISEEGKVLLAEETDCCHLFGVNASAPIPLEQGRRYYIETIHREGPEDDYCQVAAKLADDPTDPATLTPLAWPYIGVYADGSAASIAGEPPKTVVAVLPPESTTPVLYSQDFEGTGGGFDVYSENAPTPWTYDPERESWIAAGHNLCFPPSFTALTTPGVTVEHPGELFLVLRHRYNFQRREVALDGGQILMSVNGEPYTSLSGSGFWAYGYTDIVQGDNIFNGQAAFAGSTPTHQMGHFVATVASLGTFAPGDSISLQFVAAWDSCRRGLYPNWEIKQVDLTHTVAEISIAATGMLDGEPVEVANDWSTNWGAGFLSLDSIDDALWVVPVLADDNTQFKSQLTVPGMTAESSIVTLRVTRAARCEIGGPYVATCAPDRPGLAVQLDGSASSDPDNDLLSFIWSSDAAGVSFSDPASATPIMYVGEGFAPAAACNLELALTDAAGATTRCTTTVDTSASLEAPTIALDGGDQTFTCVSDGTNDYVELGAVATDNCGRDLEVAVTADPAPDTQAKGTYVVSYQAADVFGNQTPTLTRTVVVEEPPAVLQNVPDDLVVECNQPGGVPADATVLADYLAAPMAVDGCDSDESVVNDAPDVLPLGETIVTWTVWDDGPTGTTASRTVTVQDTTPPTIAACPAPRNLSSSADCQATMPDLSGGLGIEDNATAAADLLVTQTPAAGSVLPMGTTDVTFTVTDAAGLSATCTSTVTVVNGVAINCPPDLTLTTGDAFDLDQLTPATSPGCDPGTVTAAITSDVAGTCPAVRVVTVTWRATNAGGQSTTCDQTITFLDADTNGDGQPDCAELDPAAPEGDDDTDEAPVDPEAATIEACGAPACGASMAASMITMLFGLLGLKGLRPLVGR